MEKIMCCQCNEQQANEAITFTTIIMHVNECEEIDKGEQTLYFCSQECREKFIHRILSFKNGKEE